MSRPTLPPIPIAPLGPMSRDTKHQLVENLRSFKAKDALTYMEVQDWVRRGYACIWLNLCFISRVSPLEASKVNTAKYKEILPLFVNAVAAIGLHPLKASIEAWHAPHVARTARELYRGAVEARRAENQAQALPGMDIANVPPWAQALGVGGGA